MKLELTIYALTRDNFVYKAKSEWKIGYAEARNRCPAHRRDGCRDIKITTDETVLDGVLFQKSQHG